MKRVKNIFFCHGGIHALYMYIGTIRVLLRKRNMLQLNKLKVYGCSAGSAMAFVLILALNDIVTIYQIENELDIVFNKNDAFSFDLTKCGIKLLNSLFVKYVRNRNILDLVNNRLYIGISFSDKFKFISKYESHYDLCNVIMLSGLVPFFSSYSPYYNNIFCLDGGIRFRLRYIPKRTFVVYNLTYFPRSCIIPDDNKKKKKLLITERRLQ